MSLMQALRPKSKRSATVVLVSTVVILITYFIWTDAFITASIYIALLGPLALFLLSVFDLLFSSIMQLSKASTPSVAESKTTATTKAAAKSKSTVEKSTDDLFDMDPIPA